MSDEIIIPREWTVETAKRALARQQDIHDENSADAQAIANLTTHAPELPEIQNGIKLAIQAAERVCVLVRLSDVAGFDQTRCVDTALSYLLAAVDDDLFAEYGETGFVELCAEFGVDPDAIESEVNRAQS